MTGHKDGAVRLAPEPAPDPWLTGLVGRAISAAQALHQDPPAGMPLVLDLAVELGEELPAPGRGETVRLWEALATLGAIDLTLARAVEPHLDARSILGQLPQPPDLAAVGADGTSTWGVFAAEGPGVRVEATRRAGSWRLTGRKPWCSLAGRLSHAVVTARMSDGARQAFAVDLRSPGVSVVDAPWAARGLQQVPSGPIDLTEVPAVPIGGPQWYLDRPGFAWGGIGVAACWHGGAVGVARRLRTQAADREPDQIGLHHLGAVDVALHAARCVLADAAHRVDTGDTSGASGAVLAARCRQVVTGAAETALTRVAHALGPGPLAQEDEHARRVADLSLYLRQEHAERAQATLGATLLDQVDGEADGIPGWPW